MTWFSLAVISTLCFTFYGLLGRILIIDSKEPRAFSAVYNFLSGFFVLAFFAIDRFEWRPIPPFILFLTVLMIFAYGIFNRTEYTAKKYMEISLFTVVAKIATICTFALSIIFLGESISIKKLVAAFVILSANIMVFYRKGGLRLNKGLRYALIMSFFLGIAWTIDKKAASYWPLPLYAFMGYAISNIFVLFMPTVPLSSLVEEFKRTSWKVVLLAGMASSGYYFLIKAFTLGEASKIILINSTNSLITIILAIIFLKERKSIPLKIAAGILAFSGVLLLK